ncbi:hypothetical protein LSAT2_032131 [Lamellibrachia satsuma]|nr:hypothetical protein LSAT2_032131 [Lamellibrachia satsuma]
MTLPKDKLNSQWRIYDLGLDGTGCQQRLSAKARDRAEEMRVMDSLRSEGLIQRPVSRAAFGLSYDIISEENGLTMEKRPPARLAKLERRKKRRRQLTEEDITQKLEKADERKKELEQERLAKIQAVANMSDVNGSLDSTAKKLLAVEQHQKTKEEIAIENRQRRLEELQRKLRAKQEHAEIVRQRKKMAINEGDESAPGGLTGNDLTAAET